MPATRGRGSRSRRPCISLTNGGPTISAPLTGSLTMLTELSTLSTPIEPEREPVEVELGALALGQGGPVLAHRLEDGAGGVDDGLLVGEQRDPAREVGVLHPRDGGVAVPEVLERVGAPAVEEAHAGGRRDDEHLAVEGAGALELGEHEVGTALHGVGALQAGVDPDRLLGAGAVDRLELRDGRAAAHEGRARSSRGPPRPRATAATRTARPRWGGRCCATRWCPAGRRWRWRRRRTR